MKYTSTSLINYKMLLKNATHPFFHIVKPRLLTCLLVWYDGGGNRPANYDGINICFRSIWSKYSRRNTKSVPEKSVVGIDSTIM